MELGKIKVSPYFFSFHMHSFSISTTCSYITAYKGAHRGGQKTVEPDPPDQSGRPAHSPACQPAHIYTDGYGYGYFKYPDNGFSNFGRVDTRPPDNI